MFKHTGLQQSLRDVERALAAWLARETQIDSKDSQCPVANGNVTYLCI